MMVGKNNDLVNYSIIFIAISLLVVVLRSFSSFLRPLVFAILLAILFSPLVKYSKKYNIPSYITLTVTIALLLIVLIFLGNVVVSEANQITENLPEYQLKLNSMIETTQSRLSFIESDFEVKDVINIQSVNTVLSPLIHTTGLILSEIVLIIIFLIFLVPFYNSFDYKLSTLIDVRKKANFKSTIIEAERSIRNYLFTKTTISLGTALFSAFALYLFGSKFAISLAIIIFAFNFIPNIGSIAAIFVVGALFLLEVGFGYPFFFLLLLLTTIQILFGNILEPLYEGSVLKLSPFIIVLSLFFWYWVWGIGGMILAVPLTSIIKIILAKFPKFKKFADFMS